MKRMLDGQSVATGGGEARIDLAPSVRREDPGESALVFNCGPDMPAMGGECAIGYTSHPMMAPGTQIAATLRAKARELDTRDPIASFRERFFCDPAVLYFDGNSLGLLSRDAEAALLRALDQWKELAARAWFEAVPPWVDYGERLGARVAALVGAAPDEVVVTGSTTVNLHHLVAAPELLKRAGELRDGKKAAEARGLYSRLAVIPRDETRVRLSRERTK